MTREDIYAAMSEIFAELFSRSDIVMSPELSSRDVMGWDSMKQVELIMAVEDRFEIRLKSKEIENLQSIGDLVAVIEKHV